MISLMDNEVETLDDLILDISTTNDQQDFMRRISYARRRLNYLQRELEEKHALVSALTTGSARRAMGGHMGALTAAQLGAGTKRKNRVCFFFFWFFVFFGFFFGFFF